MDIFARIKNKALQAANAVGSFLQQNPTPAGFIGKQLQQAVPQVQRFVQENPFPASASPAGFASQQFQQRVAQPIGGPFIRNRVVQPVLDIPQNIQTILNPQASLPERGIAGLSTAAALVPGIDDILYGGFEAIKAKAAGNNPLQGFTGETFTPLGDVARRAGAPEGVQTAATLSELPLMLALGGLRAKNAEGAVKSVDDILSGSNARSLGRRAAGTINVTPEGVAFRTNKQPRTTSAFDSILRQVSEVLAPKPEVKRTEQLLLGPGAPERKLLSAPSPERVTVTQPNPLFSRPEIGVQGTPKGAIRKAWDALVPSAKKVIESAGPSGKKASQLLTIADEEGSMAGGKQADQLITVLKNLSPQEKTTFADVVEGRRIPLSQAQKQAVDTWNAISQDIYARARQSGLDIGKIEGYFPHHSIIDTKDPKAKMLLRRASERRYGNLELARQTDLPYDKDPSVLLDYIYSANQRIADAKYFGKDDRVLYNLANQTAQEGGDVGQVTKYLDQILGKNQTGELEDISRTVRGAQTVLKLNPATSITNLTQNISTALRTDIPTILKTIGNTIADPKTAFSNARKAGEIDAEMARSLEDFAGKGQGVSKWLRMIGMLGTEKVNRVIAVNAGMEYVAKLNKQALSGSKSAIRELERLGMKPAKTIDTLLGGKRISRATQFSTKAGELPYGWQTAVGKILTQFKSFSYKQTGLMGSEAKRIGQEAKQGNFKPLANALATYGVAAPLVGEVVNDLRSVIYNKKREDTDTTAERYISNILAATSFGLLDSTGGLFGKYGETGVISTALGPTAGDIAKGAETVANIGSDQPFERNKAIRNIVKTIPLGVGTTLSNTLIPNSYVDNYIGVNTGLGQEDAKTYNALKETDVQKAEAFKDQKQAERDTKPNIIDRILGKQPALVVPPKTATQAQLSEFRSATKRVLDNGGVPKADVLKSYVLKGKNIRSPLLEERMDAYKSLGSALSSETYTEEQKQAILEASGASKEDAEYFVQAGKDPQVKLQEILPAITGISDERERLIALSKLRRMVGGKQVLTREMITYLNETGVISDEEEKSLAALYYDEINNKFYYTKSYLKSGKPKRISFSQARAMYKNIKIPSYTELQGSMPSLAQTTAPGSRLISSILAKRPKRIAYGTKG